MSSSVGRQWLHGRMGVWPLHGVAQALHPQFTLPRLSWCSVEASHVLRTTFSTNQADFSSLPKFLLTSLQNENLCAFLSVFKCFERIEKNGSLWKVKCIQCIESLVYSEKHNIQLDHLWSDALLFRVHIRVDAWRELQRSKYSAIKQKAF